jgi:hypothetical protein
MDASPSYRQYPCCVLRRYSATPYKHRRRDRFVPYSDGFFISSWRVTTLLGGTEAKRRRPNMRLKGRRMISHPRETLKGGPSISTDRGLRVLRAGSTTSLRAGRSSCGRGHSAFPCEAGRGRLLPARNREHAISGTFVRYFGDCRSPRCDRPPVGFPSGAFSRRTGGHRRQGDE